MTDTQTRTRPRRFFFLPRFLPLLIAVVLVIGAFVLGALWSHRGEATKITADLISQQLSGIQELSTVEYYYTNMGKFENQVDFYGWKVPFTTKSFIVSYDGVIKAGIALDELSVAVSGSTITVTLPRARILSHEILEDSIEVFDETRNIFNQIQIEDYTGFTRDQKEAIQTRAIDRGLLTSASEKAGAAVTELITHLPGMENYSLRIG